MVDAPVQDVARAVGVEVLGRLAGGEFGAFRARTRQGRSVVLKVLVHSPVFCLDRVTRAEEFVEALRVAGYPAPRYLDVGTVGEQVYTLQEFIDAATPERLDQAVIGQLLDAADLQADQAVRVGYANPLVGGEIVEAIDTDARALREHTSDSRVLALAERIRALVAQADPAVVRDGDIVHHDFHGENVLTRAGRVVAVVDWEGARAGDFRTDLLRLMGVSIAAEHVNDRDAMLLRADVARRVPAEVRALLGAQLALQDLTFAVRWRPQALPWALATAELYLADL